MNLHLLVINVI